MGMGGIVLEGGDGWARSMSPDRHGARGVVRIGPRWRALMTGDVAGADLSGPSPGPAGTSDRLNGRTL